MVAERRDNLEDLFVSYEATSMLHLIAVNRVSNLTRRIRQFAMTVRKLATFMLLRRLSIRISPVHKIRVEQVRHGCTPIPRVSK